MSDRLPDHASTDEMYEFYLTKTSGDSTAAALLTLAEQVRGVPYVLANQIECGLDGSYISRHAGDLADAAGAIAEALKPQAQRDEEAFKNRSRAAAEKIVNEGMQEVFGKK